jgi:hypothetical protein
MNTIEIPTQLEGDWEHIVILTYGVDLPFFENAIWSQLGRRCRNKVILCDARQYFEVCKADYQSGLVRHANQRYVVDGVLSPHAFHAKALFLAKPDIGRLLVGSGNLGWLGYASGGEIFTQYDYKSDDSSSLPTFTAFWNLIMGLNKRDYIGNVANHHLSYIQQNTPWLNNPIFESSSPLRHNLDKSFINQLIEEIGDEKVLDLWMLAPFLDHDVAALENMLHDLKPHRATLLVQPGQTSVDPKILTRCIKDHPQLQIQPFVAHLDNIYIHAKLYLIKTARRALCLQGSPNLSSPALMRNDPHGNIELANLLIGKPDSFEYLFDQLELQPPITNVTHLNLEYQASSPSISISDNHCILTSGEWYGERLIINTRGTPPDLSNISLEVAERRIPVTLLRQDTNILEMGLSADSIEQLSRSIPTALRWGRGIDQVTNSIFICNHASLEAELQIKDEGTSLAQLSYLDINDDEIEQLISELETALLIDHRSVWMLAGKSLPIADDSSEDDDELKIDYSDIDYNLLQQHPKVKQYFHHGNGKTGFEESRLQIILNAITDHFKGLMNPVQSLPTTLQLLPQTIIRDSQTESEAEEIDSDQKHRRVSQERRLNRLLRNFVRRYIRGFCNSNFQHLVGFAVMAQNYFIFSNLLRRLFMKDWVEGDYIIEAWLKMWEVFWGMEPQSGYIASLSNEEKALFQQWVIDFHTDAELLASIYAAIDWLQDVYFNFHNDEAEEDAVNIQDQQRKLRNFFRRILSELPFEITQNSLDTARHLLNSGETYQSLSPVKMVDRFSSFINYVPREVFLSELIRRYNMSRNGIYFSKASISIEDEPLTVDCLVFRNDIPLMGLDKAQIILKQWMRIEKLNYYRIVYPAENRSDRLIFYDSKKGEGTFYCKEPRILVDFKDLQLDDQPWDPTINNLKEFAEIIKLQANNKS